MKLSGRKLKFHKGHSRGEGDIDLKSDMGSGLTPLFSQASEQLLRHACLYNKANLHLWGHLLGDPDTLELTSSLESWHWSLESCSF